MTDTISLMAPYFARLEKAVLSIAPEQNDELVRDIFTNQNWNLTLVKGDPVAGINPFNALPEDKDIEVSSSGLAMLWCVSAYAALTLDIIKSGVGSRDGETNVGDLISRMQKYIDYATTLRTNDVDWPDGLYRPDPLAEGHPFEIIDRIFFGAAGWILLHEIAHVHFKHEKHILPVEMISQEDDADKFATRWVFSQVGSCREREFRILAVGVAVSWLLLFEPIGGDSNHPPVVSRMMHISSFFEAKPDSVALEVFAHLIKILFFPADSIPQFDNSLALFDWTVELFRKTAT